MFTQVVNPTDRTHGGLGIGLTLARRLVDMHEGTIAARSDGLGCGSEFIVRLPLTIEQSAVGQLRHLGDSATRGAEHWVSNREFESEHRRILVVDDNVDAAESLSRMLRLQDHEVVVAHDGEAALSAAERLHPEIVLLDIGMPGMDGLEVARRIRQRTEEPQPLLVATTGFGQAADRRRIAAAGFDHHLIKPLNPGELQELVRGAGSQRTRSNDHGPAS